MAPTSADGIVLPPWLTGAPFAETAQDTQTTCTNTLGANRSQAHPTDHGHAQIGATSPELAPPALTRLVPRRIARHRRSSLTDAAVGREP
jgi:hypothetical protein